MTRVRRVAVLPGLVAVLLLAGCGAAYYGTAIGIIATQEDDEDISFPDAVPTDPVVPGYATLQLSDETITVTRTDALGNSTQVEDFEITSIDFPPGFGEAISNRDAGQSLLDGDRLVVRINGDTSQELLFGPGEVASDGETVAATIQTLVRALTPDDAAVPAEAYTLFTATFDPSTGSYRFVSGFASEDSAVVWQPAPVFGSGDEALDSDSELTAERLGLGTDNGGIEVSGAESIGVTVLNRGTDGAAGAVNLYLSADKVLDDGDLLFDRMSGDSIAVGEARRFYRTNGPPVTTLVRSDIVEVALDGNDNPVDSPRGGSFFVLFDVQPGGGETITDNNLTNSRQPVEIFQPVDEPLTSGDETNNLDTLDFVVSRTLSPISIVTGQDLTTALSITNLGDAVAASTAIDVEVFLSTDEELDEPGSFVDADDTDGLVAGLFLNPTDPNRAITVTIADTAAAGVVVTVFGNAVTVTFEAGVSTVEDLRDEINASSGGLVVAVDDGEGDPDTDLADELFADLASDTTLVQDIFLGTQTVTFPAGTENREVPFNVSLEVPDDLFTSGVLPTKVFPIYRITPPDPGSGLFENPRNNVRQAANFCRLYDRTGAAFDLEGGLFLPTEDDEDFAILDAVTLRPVNVDSISEGQQRVFRFTLPASGLSVDQSQVLIFLSSDTFDPHVDLLSSSGDLIAQSDDSALGSAGLIYKGLEASSTNRNFYLVVSSARFDESDLAGTESFALTISVNPLEATDLAVVSAAGGDDVNSFLNQRYETGDPRIENKVLVPFSMKQAKAEVAFFLPKNARVRLTSRPAFNVSVEAVFSQFTSGAVAPVDAELVLGTGFDNIVYKPAGDAIDAYHILPAGAYTLAFRSSNNQTDLSDFRLEIEAEFEPE